MANRRFIDFPIASTVGDSDIILIWQSGANKQTTKATFLSGLPENLDELNDVTISGLTNGQILRYDSVTGKWENTDQGNLDLNDLNDVSIVSPSNGQVLVYNSSTSKWENSSGGYVPYTGAVTTVNLGAQTIQAGQFVKAGGTSSQFLKADGSIDSNTYGTGTVTSVALTMPSAFNVANSPITTAGTLAVTGAGTVGQYIRGDGSLADFPQASGGGSSVNYYLNGSISQGTIGGVAYKELNKVPILGAGTQFSINADGYIASFLTDAGDPNLLEIPGGNWNFETYFSASSGGGSPTFYVELYKYDGTTFTLIASSSTSPELIAFGTNLNPYFSTLAVPTTNLALTDRLAVRFYVTHSGRTITMHTENNTLCQIVTTFTTGLTSLNGLTAQVQNLAVGTSGTDFNIASATATHTFNLPTASATNRGALSSADWTTFNNKQNALTNPVTGTGSAGQIAYFTGTSAITSESGLTWDATNNNLSIGGVTANSNLTVNGSDNTNIFTVLAGTNSRLHVGTVTSPNNDVYIRSQNNYNLKLGTNNTNYLTIFNSGNVFIGTSETDNGARLQVSGAATFSSSVTASSIIRSGGTSSQYLMADGSVSTLTNPVTGTGTTNYLPKFTGSTTIGNSNLINDASGNLGLGITPTNVSNYIRLQISGTTGGIFDLLSGNTRHFTIYNDSSSSIIGTVTNTPLIFQTNDGTKMTLTSSGNVGIGDTNPTSSAGWTPRLVLNATSAALVVKGINGQENSFGTSNGLYIDCLGNSTGTNNNIIFRTSNSNSSFSASERMRITSGGNVLIGTTTDSGENLQVKNGRSLFQLPSGTNGAILKLGRSAGAYYWHLGINGATSNFEFYDNGLNVLSNINVTTGAYTAVSDINKKKDFEDSTIGLNAILGLKPTLYRMKSESNTQKHLGFIAQEVKEYIPQAYMQNGDFIGLNEMPIIAALTKAIQELKQEIDTLKN